MQIACAGYKLTAGRCESVPNSCIIDSQLFDENQRFSYTYPGDEVVMINSGLPTSGLRVVEGTPAFKLTFDGKINCLAFILKKGESVVVCIDEHDTRQFRFANVKGEIQISDAHVQAGAA